MFMTGAKIIVNVQNSFKQILEKANNNLSLRYSFIQRDKPEAIFVAIEDVLEHLGVAKQTR